MDYIGVHFFIWKYRLHGLHARTVYKYKLQEQYINIDYILSRRIAAWSRQVLLLYNNKNIMLI